MSITVKITHTRPSTDTAWFTQTEEFTSKVAEFQSAGHIISFNVDQSSDLQSIVTIVYSSEESQSIVESNSVIDSFYQAMISYHSSNSITETRE